MKIEEPSGPRVVIFATTKWVTTRHFLLDQLLAMDPSAWEVHIVCQGIPSGYKPQFDTIKFHEISMERNLAPIRDIVSLAQWIKLIRVVRPDMVVAGTPKASLLGLASALLLRVRTRVYWLYGFRFESERGLFNWILRFAERATIAAATQVMMVSQSLKLSATRNFPRSDRKFTPAVNHPTGIDTNLFVPPTDAQREAARALMGLPEGAIAIGFLGRLTPDKGIVFLAEAIALVARSMPNVVLLIGGDRDESRPLSPDQMRDLVSPHIKLVGTLEAPLSFYHALDVFCLPSLREGLPTVVLEASACGLPVVTTTATGCVDSVVDTETGLLVPPRNSGRLATAISYLAFDHSIRSKMGVAGRMWVMENHNLIDVRQNNISTLESCVNYRPSLENQLGFRKSFHRSALWLNTRRRP